VQREAESKVRVNSLNIEKLIRKYDLSRIALIVDIEGGESDLIMNEIGIIEEKCEVVIIEFHEGYADGVERAKEKMEKSVFDLVKDHEAISIYFNRKFKR